MGTRSIVTFCRGKYVHEEKAFRGDPICSVYRQWDGYPEGRGKELATFLQSFSKGMINGIGPGQRSGAFANGISCLAAQWIAFEKRAEYMSESDRNSNGIPAGASQVGSVYMYSPVYQLSREVDAQYLYRVDRTEKARRLRVFVYESGNPKPLFVGGPARMLKWIAELEKGE